MSGNTRLTEQTVSSELLLEGKLLKVYRDSVRLPNGSESLREYVRHPGAVVIIPILDNGNLLFERQFRYAVGRVMLELPAGKIDQGEDILECGKRELREETGYEAEQWRYLGVMHPCIGYSDERIEMFLARGLKHVGSALDHDELLEIVEFSLEAAQAMVLNGSLTDAKSITALFWADKMLRLGF